MKKKELAASIAAILLSSVPPSGWAVSAAEIDELISTTRFLKQRSEEQERLIENLRQRVNELERRAATSQALDDQRGRGPANDQVQATETAIHLSTDDHGGRPSGTVQGQAITSTQGVPLFERKFSFEHGITYTHFDKRSLVLSGFLALDAILLGKINLQQIKTDQIQYDLTGRWNLSDRLSMDVNLPLVYRTSRYISPGSGGSASTFSDDTNSTTDVGDLNAGMYYQISKNSPSAIDWIGSVRIKAPTGRNPFGIKLIENADPNNNNLVVPTHQPTGNGVWSTIFGINALKTYDPIVLFGNIGYTYNFRRHFSDLSSVQNTVTPGDVRLGHIWSLGAGFALALNDRTSVSFSYAQSIQKNSRLRADGQGWSRVVGSESNSALFNSGLTYALTDNLSMVGLLSVGLTPDAPDFSVGIKFPYNF